MAHSIGHWIGCFSRHWFGKCRCRQCPLIPKCFFSIFFQIPFAASLHFGALLLVRMVNGLAITNLFPVVAAICTAWAPLAEKGPPPLPPLITFDLLDYGIPFSDLFKACSWRCSPAMSNSQSSLACPSPDFWPTNVPFPHFFFYSPFIFKLDGLPSSSSTACWVFCSHSSGLSFTVTTQPIIPGSTAMSWS